jgi:hypothetical protein
LNNSSRETERQTAYRNFSFYTRTKAPPPDGPAAKP